MNTIKEILIMFSFMLAGAMVMLVGVSVVLKFNLPIVVWFPIYMEALLLGNLLSSQEER